MYLWTVLVPNTGQSLTPIRDKIFEYTVTFAISPFTVKQYNKNGAVDCSEYLIAARLQDIEEIVEFISNYLNMRIMWCKKSEYVDVC